MDYMGGMTHRILMPLALLILSVPAAADTIPLANLSSYLNGLAQVEAGFRQENADGSKSTGQVFIHRPGRMRLDYDAPENSVVIASGGTVAIFDAKSNEPPEQYPLARTPLNLILAPQIDLSAAKMVVGQAEVGGKTHVLAQDPKHPEYGTIELIFAPSPVRLTGWILSDDMGNQTVVTLEDFAQGSSLPASLFSIEIEQAKHKG
jgi:outer membrane lipoprotein-sorting protein